MNDRILYELLYNYLEKDVPLKQEEILADPVLTWHYFYEASKKLFGKYSEIRFLIQNIIKEIDRKDKLKCQYCRIDEGLLVEPPVKAENLCKKHRQEFEEQFIDRTLTQKHPAIYGKEGMCCGPERKR
jgi:hypothetical protein